MRIAIIGTSAPSASQYDLIVSWAEELVEKRHEVSTGGADGVDTAAMSGAAASDVTKLHVFLPWKTFNQGLVPSKCNITVYSPHIHKDWTDSVHRLHPNVGALKPTVIPLHARNYGIVAHPKPVDAVIAVPRTKSNWGGTGQGMRVAEYLGIKLYNVLMPGVVKEIDDWISSL